METSALTLGDPFTLATIAFFVALTFIVAVLREKRRLWGLGILYLITAMGGGYFAYQSAGQITALAVALLFLFLALQNLRFARRK